jgi:hypothetical protein
MRPRPLGYYSMIEPQEDTWETPYPVAFPEEDVVPVPGWGMNPLLAGPYWIAVGETATVSPPSTLPRIVLSSAIGAAIGYAVSSRRHKLVGAAVGLVAAFGLAQLQAAQGGA